jgi:eukaryotic-like serine/threonine-protein kinase
MREEAAGDNLATDRATAALPKVGDLLVGKYRIEKQVGEGGMGVVFAARHEALDQLVAVKVLLADAAKGDGVIERFVREAQAAARLQSEHVARVFDAGSLENEVPFLVMEYLEGCDLEELLKLNGSLAIPDAVDYVLQALAAIAQAHAVGIIHRDLKPANLFLALRPDGTNVIKILDFGISKQTTTAGREKALTGRAVLGSPAYMPPEQLRNAKSVDFRADIWALGIVLYEMLSGVTPFDAEGVGEIFAAILENEPPPIRERRPDVSPELEAVILKCLQRKAEDRWADVGDFAVALAPFGSGKWSSLVETINSTLARSKQLRQMATPPEMRPVAFGPPSSNKLLIRAPSPSGLDEPSSPSAKVAFTRTGEFPPTSRPGSRDLTLESVPPKRSRTGLFVGLTALVIMGGAAVAFRGYLTPRIATPAIAAPPAPEPAPTAVDTASTPTLTTPQAVAATPIAAAADAGAARTAAGASATGGKRRPGAPVPKGAASGSRPEFLNSRE